MKRLFNRFEKETGIPSLVKRRMSGIPDPVPPPLKWYQKFFNWLRSLLMESRVEDEYRYATYADASIAFNKWRTNLWNKNRKKFFGRKFKRRYQFPFGDRINLFMIRKWMENIQTTTP